MGSNTIQRICDYLVHRGYIVEFDNAHIKATLTNNPIHQILCLKKADHDRIRIWISIECPINSDKLKLLETVNKLNMDLTVSCIIALIEMDCAVMVGACFPYTYEDTLFGLFFDKFLEDVYHCLKVIKTVIEDSDEGKTIIRL